MHSTDTLPHTAPVATLAWHDDLALHEPTMDATHREFVALLAAVGASDDAQLLVHWDALLTHTVAHFGQEDAWMQATGFAPDNCHTSQHQVILDVLREVARRGALGDHGLVREMTREFGLWFERHAQSMDAGLADHLQHCGFDPASGRFHGGAPAPLSDQRQHECAGGCA